ncbi:hypothetical protein D3C79_894200 [compost metagenome]
MRAGQQRLDVGDLVMQMAAMRIVDRTFIGEVDAPCGTVQQPHRQGALKVAQMGGNHRGGKAQCSCCTAEAAVIDDSHENFHAA